MSKFYLNNDKIYNILIILFPLTLIIGSAAVNIFLILISILTIYEIYKRSEILKPIKTIFWTFSLFYIFLLISSFYAENFIEAFRASFSQLRFFLFTIFVYYFFKPEKYLNLLVKFWTILIVLVSLDTFLQFFSGIDIFGYKAEGYTSDERTFLSPFKIMQNQYVGRLSGPFGDELIVGAFLAKISAPLIIYYLGMNKFYNFKDKIYAFLILSIIILTILISGERTSFLIIFTCFVIFLLFKDIKKLFIFIFMITIFIFTIYSSNNFFQNRVNNTLQIIKDIPKSSYGRIYHSSIEVWKKNKLIGTGLKNYHIIIFTCFVIFLLFKDIKKLFIFIFMITIFIFTIYSSNNFFQNRVNNTLQIIKDIPKSSYGRIYHSSIEVWKKNKLIGTGLKNYHINCIKLKDPNPNNIHKFCSPNHSHNFILQILVETGILGIIFFYIFMFSLFKSFFKKFVIIKTIKYEYKYFASGSLFMLAYTVFPSIIPSGSFFTTWNGSFFWLHMGFILNFFIRTNKNQ